MAKSSEAFRNIGEVAAELEVKKHVLRFWEVKFPQVKPMKRGGGRRLYRPADVELLRGIRDLLQDAGYTIKGVQKILREQGVDYVKTALDAHLRAKHAGEQQPAKTSTISEQSMVLDDEQLKALRDIVSELKSCQQILSGQAKAPG